MRTVDWKEYNRLSEERRLMKLREEVWLGPKATLIVFDCPHRDWLDYDFCEAHFVGFREQLRILGYEYLGVL